MQDAEAWMKQKFPDGIAELYRGPEKPELPENPGGEELDVYMIELDYRDQADLARKLLDYIGPLGDEVNGKPSEVLRVWTASDGSITKLVPPPGRKLDPSFPFYDEIKPGEEDLVDPFEGD